MAALSHLQPHLLKPAKHPSPPSFQMEMLMMLHKRRPFSTEKCIRLFSDIIYYKRHDCRKDWGISGWILCHWHFPFTDGRRDFCYSQSGDELRAHSSRSAAPSPPQSSLLLKRIPEDEAGTWLCSNPDRLLESRIGVRHFSFVLFQRVSVQSCKSVHPPWFLSKVKIREIIIFNIFSAYREIIHDPKLGFKK